MRPLVLPAPHAIGQALDVGGAQPEVPGVAGEHDASAVLVVRAVDYPPAAVLQGEGADAGAHHHCGGRRRAEVEIPGERFPLYETQSARREEDPAKIRSHFYCSHGFKMFLITLRACGSLNSCCLTVQCPTVFFFGSG